MDVEVLVAAGLYDPAAPNAADRLALIERYLAMGIGLDEMVDYVRSGATFAFLGGDRMLRPGPHLTVGEIAARVGVEPARIRMVRRAVGLPDVTDDDPAFVEADVVPFTAFEMAAALFGDAPSLHFVRVLGTSLATVAEAANWLFVREVEAPLAADGGNEVALHEANTQASTALTALPDSMGPLFASHVVTAIRRHRDARGGSFERVDLGVGFVDLVGYTTLAATLPADELVARLAEFEAVAHDAAAAVDGRVVKLIGDEVMFVTPDAASACSVARAIVEAFRDDPVLRPSGGLAAGALLARGGDYYGVDVNLAARAASVARPGEVLVSEAVAAGAPGERFGPLEPYDLKGFPAPVPLAALLTAAPG